MRISHRHRFVFLAMPRTGSTSIRNVLDPYSDIASVPIANTSAAFPFYHHISADELQEIFRERSWEWSQYVSFCVVRNPYDRVVSLYHHYNEVLRGRNPQLPIREFAEYVAALDPGKRLMTSLRNFICNAAGQPLVTRVFMYERLDEEMPDFLRSLGVTLDAGGLPRLNVSKERASYRHYYDNASRRRVESAYREEIERFGYSF